MRSDILATAAIVALASTAAAHADDDQNWAAVTVTGPVAKGSPVLVWLDLHDRSFASSGDRDITIIRPGIGYRVSPSLDLWVGYAWVTAARDGADLREERLWQQATYPLGDLLGGKVTGRTRLEQRMREGDSDVGLRLRQQLRYAHRFDDSPFGVVAWNEAFFALNDTSWGQVDGFDQNRLFLGLSFEGIQGLRLEGGYLNQIVNGTTSDVERDNLQVSATVVF
jgi:hypothetical protein